MVNETGVFLSARKNEGHRAFRSRIDYNGGREVLFDLSIFRTIHDDFFCRYRVFFIILWEENIIGYEKQQ